MTTLKQANKKIQEKFPDVYLVQGNGYVHIWSDNSETQLRIAGLYSSTIEGVCKVSHQTPDQWLRDVELLLKVY